MTKEKMTWDNVKEVASSDANVFKFVYTKKDAVAEVVLYKYPTFEERTVICCSTQSGCPVGCRFCGAGDYFVRNLTAEEIVEQVTYLFSRKKIDISKVKKSQIMFMSMGEPMLNFKALEIAIRSLNEKFPSTALLISTSGPDVGQKTWHKLAELSKEIPVIGLQFSVHESTDEARNKLIPFKRKLSLREMSNIGNLWGRVTGRRPYFNYCVHSKNNKPKDVKRLSSLFDPAKWEATLSVICERDEHVAAANERQRELVESFMENMIGAGFSARMFNPAGQDDIGGGCGQLWYVQDWMKSKPDLVTASVGNGLPKIHTPKLY